RSRALPPTERVRSRRGGAARRPLLRPVSRPRPHRRGGPDGPARSAPAARDRPPDPAPRDRGRPHSRQRRGAPRAPGRALDRRGCRPHVPRHPLRELPPPARARLGLGPDVAVLGSVARFDPVKRLAALVGALQFLNRPGVALLLVGDGPEAERLRRQVAAAGLGERVVFAGWLDDPARVHPALDLYVAASLKEGLPLAVLEAMGAGLAVVATDVPGHRDVVKDGETGLLVAP